MKKLIGILVGVLLLNIGTLFLLKYFFHDSGFEMNQGIKIIQRLTLVVVVMFLLRKMIYDKFKNSLIIIPLCMILCYLAISNVINTITINNLEINVASHLLFFTVCLSVGLFEELLFRVYAFHQYHKLSKKRNLIKSIIITSLLFAFAHVTSLLNSEVVKISVIVQIIFAFGMGILLQAIYIRFKNIILIVILHGLVNYLGSYKTKLLQLPQESSEYTFEVFLMSAGIMLGFVIFFAAPISYLLIKKDLDQLKKEGIHETLE